MFEECRSERSQDVGARRMILPILFLNESDYPCSSNAFTSSRCSYKAQPPVSLHPRFRKSSTKASEVTSHTTYGVAHVPLQVYRSNLSVVLGKVKKSTVGPFKDR